MTPRTVARVGASRTLRLAAVAALVGLAPLGAGAQPAPVGQSTGLMETVLEAGSPASTLSPRPSALLEGMTVEPEQLYPALQVHMRPDHLSDAAPHVTVNPEPSTLALLAGAGLVLGATTARRRGLRAR
jgi:hypothetical protein